ncbi:MAG: pro-sigmaK processing inhibitor BofA family protein [Clostridia bacterium]|nr:pro-sigmaK processing inhibitor BofA family protein [Clostridia bacterium]
MGLEFMQVVFGIGLLLVIVAILNKLVVRPIKMVFRVGYSLVFGMILIWAFNYIGEVFGLYIPANIVTILTAGILGLPGLGLMVVLQLLV